MRQGKEVVVHGDGTSLWTLTHHDDFARGFVPLLGHPRAVGDAFHITSDDVLTWNQIAETLGRGGRRRRRGSCTCRPTRSPPPTPTGAPACSATRRTRWSSTTRKLRSVVPDYVATIPFEQGAREIVAWHDEDPAGSGSTTGCDAVMDRLVEAYRPRPLG